MATVPEKIAYFYLTDSAGRLVGVAPTRHLLAAQSGTLLESIMIRDLVTLPAMATVQETAEAFLRSRLLALPIVGDNGELLGVVNVGLFTASGLIDRRGRDDVFQLIGIHLAQATRIHPWIGFRARFPWLLSTILGGLVCALLASRHEGMLETVVVIAVFLPVVLALGESVAVQSITITLQWLQIGVPLARRVLRAMGQEFITAALLGLASGALVGIVVGVWKGRWMAAAAIGSSIALSIVTSCVFGLLLPVAVRAVNIDPKLAAGPLVLASADVATLIIYLSPSAWMLQ